MALAKKCDRCGKLYEHYEKDKEGNACYNALSPICFDKTKDHYVRCNSKDLCPECRDSFEEWLHLPGIIK